MAQHFVTLPVRQPDQAVVDATTPTEQRNVEVVLDVYRRVVDGRRTSAVAESFDAGFVQHNPLFGVGRGGFAETVGRLARTFSDLAIGPEVVVAQNDRVLAFTTWTGHDETGQELAVRVADLYRLFDGRLVEHWDVVDYTQLEAFGIDRPEQHQPDTWVDPIGTPPQLANLELLQRYVSEITVQDTSRAANHIRADFVQHDPMVAPGLDGYLECCAFFADVAPDCAAVPHHVVAGSRLIGAVWDWNGHLPGGGARLLLPTSDIYRVDDEGMLAEHWAVADYTFVKALLGEKPTALTTRPVRSG